jgi:hypothetical protein
MKGIITICGSTKFKKEFEAVIAILTMKGYGVLTVGSFGHMVVNDDIKDWIFENKVELDKLHKDKINTGDSIFVVNVGGYVGESTKSEIEYALKNHKKVYSLRVELGPEPQLFTNADIERYNQLVKSYVY